MGKSKDTKVKAAPADPIKSVKNAGVTKPSKSSDAKSKKLAKEVASKAVNGKEKKKSKKVESESESESESEDSASDSSDSSDSESESEEEKPAAKTNGKVAKKAESESESESDSDSDSSDSDSDSDEEEEEEKEAAKPKEEKKETKAESDSESDSDSDSDADSSDSDSDEEEEKAEEPSKKRKADDEEPAAAKKAKTDDAEEGAEAAAEPAEGTTLFAGNLGWKVDDNLLYEEFKVCEGLVGARVITDREQQRSRGFGYVDFETPEAAKAAFEKMQGYFIEGRELKLDFSAARPKNDGNNNAANRAKKYGDTISPESDTLFVGNLPFHADEDSVSAFFNEVANVKSLRLPTDMESGRPKGFGYVSFYSVDDARKAFEQLNGQDCAGRNVRLDYSTPKPRNDFGGGRGGGRGGFGGGRGGGRGGFGGGRGGPRGGGRGGFGGSSRGGSSGFQGKKTTF
ncbi:nuclear localization sequence binding protein [Sporothrix eucalyptigena]|uniref:Nuclear localization sequence binding protein n=1 Tax=Sporothrix eucalyptigena TaxID=1812306 RepID=A0ABP0C0G6_9PEZI